MAFFSTTALGPESPLFRGRQAELARLAQLCQDEVTSYTVVYGGRQNGKTSLLLRLEAQLASTTSVCRVDFQLIKGASPEQTFALLAGQIARAIPLAPDASRVSDGPDLLDWLSQALARPEIARLVLLLDELGALPIATRQELANALRSFFHTRLVRPALAKLQIVFSGGVELYDLVVTEASSLHNICEEVYLTDLAQAEAVALIADGLRGLGLAADAAESIGAAVYARAAGHPYLTQKIGSFLELYHRRGEALTPDLVDTAARQILRGDPLLRRIRDDLREQRLEDAARRLLSDPPRFTRLDDDMARLELIGLAKEGRDRWAPRNALLADVFREILGLPPARAVPAPPKEAPATSAPTPAPAAPALEAQAVITAKKRRLSKLEQTAAIYGVDCPPHVAIEIEDLRRELAELERNAATLPQDSTSSAPVPATPTPATAAPAPPAPPAPAAQHPPPDHSSLVTRHSSLITPPLVHVPAGPFLMGSSNDDKLAEDDEKPQHKLELPDFWIGKTPVTNAQFQPFVEGDGYRNRDYWTTAGWQWREQAKMVKPGYWDDAQWNGADYPVVGVNWFEAVAYIRWLSAQTGHPFRLPSEAEWEKTARGPDGRVWPWGDRWENERCNSEAAGIKQTTPVGQYANGASPYGALDMAGNVWEWCATQWRKTYPYTLEDEWRADYLEADVVRVLRGGSWYNQAKFVRGACRTTHLQPARPLPPLRLAGRQSFSPDRF